MAGDLPLLSIDGTPVSVREALRILKHTGGYQPFVQTLLDHHLVEKAATRDGVKVSDQALQEASDAERRSSGLYSAADTHAWFEENGMTVEDWELAIEHRLLRSALADRIFGQGAVEARFAAQSDAYTLAAISALSIDSREKADELAEQLRGEEATFAVLARKHSTSDLSRDAGGLLGWVSLEDLPKAVRAAVSASQGRGEILGPLESEGAWCLIQVHAIQRPKLTGEVKDEIREALLAEWLETERKRSRIDHLVRP
ncbi:MAG: peptidylprolyl isomerase [Planctomycetes bacterium]|nr:peptidylprolyl isomerase [Planctomycetota bacterium]